ncbi:MAG: hypothetical protein E7497_06820 [Ruminococcus sp.]|nr:hypothetical protein [Ruminococcus sp.]
MDFLAEIIGELLEALFEEFIYCRAVPKIIRYAVMTAFYVLIIGLLVLLIVEAPSIAGKIVMGIITGVIFISYIIILRKISFRG